MQPRSEVPALIAIKVLHTAIWAFLAGSILALPAVAWMGLFGWAAALTAIILIECGVIALNKRRCPLTGMAARYTANRAYNFDIYLPVWLARYNQQIFGALFIAGEEIVL